MKRRSLLGLSVVAVASACRAAPGAQPTAMPSGPPRVLATAIPSPSPRPAASPPASPSPHDLLYIRDDYGVRGPGQIAVVDVTTGQRVRSLPLGLWPRDWSALYTTTWSDSKTAFRAIDPASGAEIRQATLDDVYDLVGFSPDGKWVALQWEPSREEAKTFEKNGTWKSRFLILDRSLAPRSDPATAPIALDSDFWFDAIDDSATSLFLIENLDPSAGDRYRVRLFDRSRGGLQPGAIADKTGSEVMRGYRQSSVFSPDGTWLYSLYLNQTKGPFVHALNLAQRFAVCIDLPSTGKEDYEKQLLWSTAMMSDGATLYATNDAFGLVAAIDLTQLRVVRAANIPVASAAAPGPLTHLKEWLAPVAEAKRLLMGGSALSPDGRTLFAIGAKGLLAIATSDLTLRAHYLPDRTLDSVAVNPDGSRLYVVDAEQATILALDPATNGTVAIVHGADHPWAVLRVVMTGG